MWTSVDNYLKQVNKEHTTQERLHKMQQILSLMVVLCVFWGLKLTGITMAGEAFCGKEEHVHTDACILPVLVCTQEEIPAHVHEEACLQRNLICELPEQEGHSHGDDCLAKTLICTQEELEGHTHGEGCFTKTLTCELPEEEAHSHGEGCYVMQPGCGLEESEEHTHDDGCMVSTLICEIPETPGHSHEEACYTTEQCCELEEIQGHTHTEECFRVEEGYICGLEPCEAHFHEETCWQVEEGNFICGLEETEGHTHDETCYEISEEGCMIEEHVHVPWCYSDISADLEDSTVWEESLADLIRSPSTAENIIQVAQSQLGAKESVRNFEVDENGIRRGITRYGQWYGNPYGDWSAMFVGFCLEYAGVTDVPISAGPETMRLQWAEEGLYASAGEHVPEAGQLLFLDRNEDGTVDAVAILEGLGEDKLLTIEGDVRKPPEQETSGEKKANPKKQGGADYLEDTDMVLRTEYSLDDPTVMGYGLVPFEPGLMLLPEGAEIMPLAARRTIWLDGTNGGLMALGNSPNRSYTAEEGTKFRLPTEWQSPDKYSYVLRGWYDVINSKYYKPGAEVTVDTRNMLFYADWVASSYDVGQFNSQVTNTVSTSDFVTIRMFDYGNLFNVMSTTANVTFSNSGHSETWSLLTSGKNPYNGQTTLNYIFRDWDANRDITYPSGTNTRNTYSADVHVYQDLYTNQLRDLLFGTDNSFDPETGTGVIGKQYLGTADHLFKLMTDPDDPHYGYYYYNSEWNAASYNQSDQRFYVYDYLERTTDSANASDSGKYSDFLPLNSPYVNTNGRTPKTYTYSGSNGEFTGTTHYMYEAKDDNNSPVGTNYLFGMSIDVDFYLPNKPGTGGNKDFYGKDMHFKFSGDDDVWVFVDGKLVLDLGGIHGIESGDINFSTGVVTINGVKDNKLSEALTSISAGEQTLTIYYLERGSSQSNCAIYFNLAPRFSFSIQKEDVLTRDVLNGAQFSVYTDKACTVPAQLWPSKASHDADNPSTNVFTVQNGVASMWGMSAGNEYYIKETKPPDDEAYGFSNGVICLTFDEKGTASYNVEIKDNGQGITGGFTVHGFRIDTETQNAYIVATNAPKWVKETTQVHALKVWDDNKNHDGQSIAVYLTTTDPDGTVRRLQETVLSSENDWYHTWENLPKYREDGVTPVVYGVEEAYTPGYYSKIELVDRYPNTETKWEQVNSFVNGETYILGTSRGYISTRNANSDIGYMWVDQKTAMESDFALWKATVSGQTVKFTNGKNQSITFYYNGGSSGYPTDFYASTGGESDAAKQYFRYVTANNGVRIYYDGADGRDYYMVSDMTDAQKFKYSTTASSGMILTPMTKRESVVTEEVTGWAYLVTNTPIEKETSLAVEKHWDYGNLPPGTAHEKAQVTIKLLAYGRDTGRTVTLSLKNGWKDTFRGLPYTDADGNVISYSVLENWENADWIPYYEEVVATNSSPPTYSTVVTNRYRWGMGGPELPSTGTAARMNYILCGGGMMLTSLVYAILLRRKRERRMQ